MRVPIELAPGTVIGDSFRIERPLSAGGMGAVYAARQLKTGRLRALKIMHPALAKDAKFRERFEQEARVGAEIESDHVVEVVDAGVDGAIGVPYLAMELLDGEDLHRRVERGGPLGLDELRRVFAEIGHAMRRAHAAGIVHRDLKPENLFLASARRERADYVVKVLDFGIAKVVAEATTGHTQAIGSPMWMAPEQTTPTTPITAATDVWSLGLIAFHALTGRSYWRTPNSPAPTPVMLLREVALEPLPPASERAAELGCAAQLPRGFDDWFGRAVVRDPAARFASVGELVRALDDLTPVEGARAEAANAEVARVEVARAAVARAEVANVVAAPANTAAAKVIVAPPPVASGTTWPPPASPANGTAPAPAAAHAVAAAPSPTAAPPEPRAAPNASLAPTAPLPPSHAGVTADGPYAAGATAPLGEPLPRSTTGDFALLAARELDVPPDEEGRRGRGRGEGAQAPRRWVAAAIGLGVAGAVIAVVVVFATRGGVAGAEGGERVGTASASGQPLHARDGGATTAARSAAASSAATAPPGYGTTTVATNRWVVVTPPSAPSTWILGLDPGQDDEAFYGFRRARAVTAPSVAFEIEEHETTWGELDAWRAADPNAAPGFDPPAWLPGDAAARALLPATGVPRAVAAAYCASERVAGAGREGSLPTDEQWEYAARGPERRPFAWGAEPFERSALRAYVGRRRFSPADLPVVDVMTTPRDRTPGPAPIYDLTGNAREWTAGPYRDSFAEGSGAWDANTWCAVRGLPLAADPPPRPHPAAAAFRGPVCHDDAGCGARAREERQFVGFRCVRRAADGG